MNEKTSDEFDARWIALVRQARADVGPPINLPALLRAVRAAEPPVRHGWFADFATLFAPGRALSVCLATGAACAFVAVWQAWEVWQALPWVELLAATTGGMP